MSSVAIFHFFPMLFFLAISVRLSLSLFLFVCLFSTFFPFFFRVDDTVVVTNGCTPNNKPKLINGTAWTVFQNNKKMPSPGMRWLSIREFRRNTKYSVWVVIFTFVFRYCPRVTYVFMFCSFFAVQLFIYFVVIVIDVDRLIEWQFSINIHRGTRRKV